MLLSSKKCTKVGYIARWAVLGSIAAVIVGCSATSPIGSRSLRAPSTARLVSTSNEPDAVSPQELHPEREWHVDLGFRTGYTKLASTKQKLDRRLKLPMKLDVFNLFSDPTTPLDRKSSLGLNTLYFGLGRQESDWLKWTYFVGGGAGADKTHQRVANLNAEVDFSYGYYYTGLTFELYPWGTPKRLDGLDWHQRLHASRPYILTGAEVGYVSAKGRGSFSVAPIMLYEDKEKIRDWLVSGLIGLGWGIPISERWSVNLSGHYSIHAYRPEEYNTWNLVSVVRYHF